jgi:hypothetical protein
MKLVSHFDSFLKDTVDLNPTRIQTLEDRAAALRKFIRQADWGAEVVDFDIQGSWAHKTIIKPVDQGEFDADLLVLVEAVDGWDAKDYIKKLASAFKGSESYKDKYKAWDYCVTLTYANDAQIDIAPLVIDRVTNDEFEVCNKRLNVFERSEPAQYTKWLVEQNGYSGSNSFRKVTRLLKYLRDIKTRFVCPSVLLTTLIAHQINPDDKNSESFADVPTSLQTIVARLDDWLQANIDKPMVCNPFLPSEDFAAAWSDAQYENFRSSIHRYRGWIDEAVAEADRDASVLAWRRLFGDEFAPSITVEKSAKSEGRYALANAGASTGGALRDIVDAVKLFGRKAIPKNFWHVRHMQRPTWIDQRDPDLEVVVSATIGGPEKHMNSKTVLSAEPLQPNQKIWFEAKWADGTALGPSFQVQWRITNTGDVPNPRGGFYPAVAGEAHEETLEWRGVHLAEAFVIRTADNCLVSVSEPFYVTIE